MDQTNRKFGGVKIAVLAVGVSVLGVGGFAAYKYMFARPGENAVALLPADADVVITLDTNPGPAQVKAFKAIGDALNREGVSGKITSGLSSFLGKQGVAEELRPYIKDSFAGAFWPPLKGSKMHGVMLISISDPSAVSGILAKIGTPGTNGTFDVKGATIGVVGSYMAMASDAETIGRVQAVRDGKEGSMAGVQEYILARSDLPQDANFMAFVSPKAMKAIAEMTPSMKQTAEMYPWMGFSATIRDDGFQFDGRVPVNKAAMPSIELLAASKPIDQAVFRHLPAGAYGVVAYSEVDNLYKVFEASLNKAMPQQKDQMNKGIAEFEKQTGLSIPNDIEPALKGTALLAAYPAANGEAKSADFVLLFDNSNGANPTALAEKIVPTIDRIAAKETSHPHFVKTEENGATVYALDEASQKKMIEGMGSRPAMPAPDFGRPGIEAHPSFSSGEADRPDAAPSPGETRPSQPTPVTPTTPQTPTQPVPPMVKDKTITWAEIDGCVIIASSKGMLTKAIAAFKGGPTLTTDTAFTSTLARSNGDQSLMIISMRRVLEALRPVVGDTMRKGGGPDFDDIVNLFGPGDTAMYMGGRYHNDVSTGTWFMPLDYERVAKLIHKTMDPPAPRDIPTMPAPEVR